LRPLPIGRSCRYPIIVAMNYGCLQGRFWGWRQRHHPTIPHNRAEI
jgi:hypothetical protein